MTGNNQYAKVYGGRVDEGDPLAKVSRLEPPGLRSAAFQLRAID